MKQTARKIIAILLTVAMIQGTGGLFSFATTTDVTQAADGAQPNAVSEETVAAGDSEAEALGQDFESAEEQQEADSDTEQQDADADTEQQNADADAEQQDAEPAEEMTYQYSDRQIEVTAVASDADAIPDGAKLVVTPVTAEAQGYSYDAYMNALNAKAGEGTAYTDRNTLLYDIAFMDGSREIQPASGTVDIKVNFKKDQLSKSLGAKAESDVQILHLPIKEGAAESAKSTKAATDLKASDVLVENVDADVAMGKTQTAEFALSDFSILSIASNPDKYGTTDQTNSQTNFALALGRAVEYGIVADTYDQKNHQQTNFAVKTFKNSGQINGEPDLAGTWNVPYQIGEIALNKLRFGTNTYQGKEVQYDVYLPKTYAESINNYVQIDGGGKDKVNVIYENEGTIKDNVQKMLTSANSKSQLMASHATTIDLTNDVVTDQNQLVVDTTNYADNAVIYLNVPDSANYSNIRNVLSMQSSFHLHKNPNQVIVINILGSKPVALQKMIVTLPGEDKSTKDDKYSTYSPSGQNSPINDRIDEQIAQKVIWNIPNASKVTMNTSAGVFLVPNGDVDVTGTSAGWIVSGGTVTTDGCEFHYVYRDRHYTPQSMTDVSRNLRFTAYKGMKDAKGNVLGLEGRQFDFSLYETDATYDTAGKTPIETVKNSKLATVNFSAIEFTESLIEEHNGVFHFVVKEDKAGETKDGVTNWDGQINYELHAEVVDGGIVFNLYYYRYLTAEDMADGKTDNTVREINVAGEEFTSGSVYNHYDATTKIQLGAVKTLDGDNPKAGAFDFTLTEVADAKGTPLSDDQNAYTDTKSNDADGKVTFDEIEYVASDASTTAEGEKHYYKISEKNGGDAAISYDRNDYIVTVTVKDDGKGNLTAEADKNPQDIAFANTTNTGKLELTKTIKGAITEEEAEGALTFEVTTGEGADKKWLDKDGSLSSEKVELTLKDFTHTEGTDSYVLTIDKVEIGNYTVTETTKDVDGKDVTVTYKVNNGEKQAGDAAAAEVEKDKTTSVAFEDDYKKKADTPSNPEDGPKGNLDITTVIRGDVSQKDVENTLKFEVTTVVTDKDGNEVTKWLDKDGKLVDEKTEFTLKDGFVTNDGGKTYVKRFKGVPIGKYTIKETETNIDGFEFQDGNSVIISDAEVVENETAHLNLEDEYARTNPDEEASEQTEDQSAAQTTEPPTKTSKDSQSKEKSDRSVGTGDDASLGMMIALMLASLTGIVGVAIHSRRRRDAR